MPKRNAKPRPAKAAPAAGTRPAWTSSDGHSGEGAASALAMLQRLEKHRGAPPLADPGPRDDPRS